MSATRDPVYLPTEVPRRAALSLGLAAAAGLLVAGDAGAQTGGIKLTVLYGAPKDPAAFDKYYFEKHLPMLYAIKEIKRSEVAKGLPGPGGKPPAFYLIAEVWFDNLEQFKQVTATPEWKAIVADVPNFAPEGAIVLVSKIG